MRLISAELGRGGFIIVAPLFITGTPMFDMDAKTAIEAAALATTWIATGFATIRSVKKMITDHEKQDERRHRQNLMRFGWISSSLARVGVKTDIPTFDD